MNIAKYILPIIVLIIIIYAYYKKTDIIEEFIKGVNEGYKSSLNIFPTILGMLLAISIFTKSGILTDIAYTINKIFPIFKIPLELLSLIILKPISGSVSLVVLNDILNVYHPDSYIGKLASIIAGSTDTTIYIIALYFGSVKIKKTTSVLKVGLLTDLATIIISLIIATIFFK